LISISLSVVVPGEGNATNGPFREGNGMSGRKILFALGICAALAGVYGIASANEQGMLPYEASDYSPSADPSWPPSEADATQVREPIDTGSVPGTSEKSMDQNCCGDGREQAYEVGTSVFRRGIDDGE
jgi:hypothetical protein